MWGLWLLGYVVGLMPSVIYNLNYQNFDRVLDVPIPLPNTF